MPWSNAVREEMAEEGLCYKALVSESRAVREGSLKELVS